MVLWQLLTASRPYEDLSLNRFLLLQKIANDGLRPSVPQWMPSSIEGLIRESWSEAEHLRPTANELVQRLLALQAASDTEGRDTERSDPARVAVCTSSFNGLPAVMDSPPGPARRCTIAGQPDEPPNARPAP